MNFDASLKKDLERFSDGKRDSQNILDKYLITLSGGALVVSFGIVGNLNIPNEHI